MCVDSTDRQLVVWSAGRGKRGVRVGITSKLLDRVYSLTLSLVTGQQQHHQPAEEILITIERLPVHPVDNNN